MPFEYHINNYKSELAKYLIEIDSPYNDGWTQSHYREKYEQLIKISEAKYNQQVIEREINTLQEQINSINVKIDKLKIELENP